MYIKTKRLPQTYEFQISLKESVIRPFRVSVHVLHRS